MPDILFHYERVNPTSWAYLSSLLMLALFFKFNRVWSLRNLDLFLLISLAPGLLLVQYSFENLQADNAAVIQKIGFLWLFASGALLMTRMLLDPAMRRRPLLDPNLNTAGLAFLGGSLLFFLMANVVFGRPIPANVAAAEGGAAVESNAESIAAPSEDPAETAAPKESVSSDTLSNTAPGFLFLFRLPRITTQKLIDRNQASDMPQAQAAEQQQIAQATTRVMAIISHLLVVSGLILIGVRHFDNLAAGVATATMYLMLPYTALFTGSVDHCLPAAVLVWAVVLYRRPVVAGLLIGLATGTIYYPAFLIPLWCSYYWDRGLKRFVTGLLIMLAVLVITQAATAESWAQLALQLRQTFGIRLPTKEAQGIWRFWSFWYRMPVLAAFVALSFSFVVWPVRKNLGSLICCSAALMLGAQFWYPDGGGLYIAWYLPLVLLTIFRPNLEETYAFRMVREGWWQQRQRRRAVAE